jgi:pilus assembly protein Flp/PilA
MKHLKKLISNESGATAIEYGLIAALVSVTIIAVVTLMGQEVQGTFQDVTNGLQARP